MKFCYADPTGDFTGVGPEDRTGAAKFIMNSKELSDIVKVTAAMLVKDDKIIIARRGPDDKLEN